MASFPLNFEFSKQIPLRNSKLNYFSTHLGWCAYWIHYWRTNWRTGTGTTDDATGVPTDVWGQAPVGSLLGYFFIMPVFIG